MLAHTVRSIACAQAGAEGERLSALCQPRLHREPLLLPIRSSAFAICLGFGLGTRLGREAVIKDISGLQAVPTTDVVWGTWILRAKNSALFPIYVEILAGEKHREMQRGCQNRAVDRQPVSTSWASRPISYERTAHHNFSSFEFPKSARLIHNAMNCIPTW